ncbi:MAG: hypothetical protein HY553_09340 [Elusimicrobia bacterium]|nr:hypothetical protein [Elusimicrobiota bacterium]
MKRPRKRAVCGAAFLAASLGAVARAQVGTWSLERPPEELEGPAWALNYDGAYAFPEGPDGPSKEGSPAFQISLEKRQAELLWIGLEIGHQFGHTVQGRTAGRYVGDMDGDNQPDYLDFSSDVKDKVFHIAPFLRLGKVFGSSGRLRVRHTVAAAPGFYHSSSNQGTFTLTGTTSRGTKLSGVPMVYGASSRPNFGLSFGSALDFWFREGLSLGIELRYHRVFDAAHHAGYVWPTGRFTFFF